MSEFIQKVEFNGQKYETPLPWKTESISIKNQLVSLFHRLQKDPVVLKTYDNIIKSEEAEGIIE